MTIPRISLEKGAYDRLAAAKKPGESFSDVVNRLTRERGPSLLDLVGILDQEAAQDLQEAVKKRRQEESKLPNDASEP